MEKSYAVALLNTDNQIRKSTIKLVSNAKTFEVFDNMDTCIDYVTDAKQRKIFLIVTKSDAEVIIPILDDFQQLHSFFVLCSDGSKIAQWIVKHPKVKGVFNNIMLIFEHIEETQYNRDNVIGFDVVNNSSTSSHGDSGQKNKQEVMFMYGQLIKEILTRMQYSTVDINYMFDFFFVKYIDDPSKIEQFIQFEHEYKTHTPVWWYTREFLYSMLNKALRTHDISALYPMRVFIQDLHQQLVQLHANSSETVVPTLYRGQLIPTEEFEKIKINPGGLLSINNFLSTTCNKALAEIFAGDSNTDPNMTSVLLQINVDSSMKTTAPFANIEAFSNFGAGEEEYLFTMGSVFRIESIEKSGTNNGWCVKLKLTDEHDPDLIRLTGSIRSVLISDKCNHTHICSLGMLLMMMDQSELGTEILETVLKGNFDPAERFKIYFTLGTLYTNLKDSQQAFENYENIIKSYVLRFLPINVIGFIYYGLGELCVLQRKFKLALINMEIALGVEQFCRPKSDGRQLAHYYHAIGQVHAKLCNNNEALRYYQMAIDLARQCFPHHHPFIANCMASKSILLYHENRLEEASSDVIESGQILANSLSTNHGMQVLVHMTTAQNLLKKNDFSGALLSYQSALKCSHEHISPNHPKNAPILWAIAFVHSQQKQFDEALSILQEALNIQTAVLPSNHPNLAMTYTLIGDVLDNQRNPSALSYYHRALDIQLKCLPATHPSIVHLQQGISRLERRLATKRFT